jgi:hypothetical protein
MVAFVKKHNQKFYWANFNLIFFFCFFLKIEPNQSIEIWGEKLITHSTKYLQNTIWILNGILILYTLLGDAFLEPWIETPPPSTTSCHFHFTKKKKEKRKKKEDEEEEAKQKKKKNLVYLTVHQRYDFTWETELMVHQYFT